MSQFAPRPAVLLNDRDSLEFTVQVLTDHFDLEAHGYCCQTNDLWQIMLAAAARGTTIEATCRDLEKAPDSNTVRGYLHRQFTPEQVRPLEDSFNRALAAQMPRWFRRQARQRWEWAIDFHDVPYYGKADQKRDAQGEAVDSWVCRGEAQAGTTRFYRCATAYAMHHDQRWTIAVTFVHSQDSTLDVLQRLLERVRALSLCHGCLYMDKGFCSVEVLGYLQEHTHLSVIVATPIRGKVANNLAIAGADTASKTRSRKASSRPVSGGIKQRGLKRGGTRALCRGRVGYRTWHTFVSAEHGSLRVPVGVVRTFALRRDGKRHAQWLVFVLLRVPAHWTLPQVRQQYRARFGIESSYRLLEQVRARTSTPNEAWRFFCIGLALLLGSIWIALHWRFLQVCGGGPRRVAREHLRLGRLANFLCHAVEAIYGVVTIVHPPNVKYGIY